MELNTAIAFILIFGALVFFHELGHLYFAKEQVFYAASLRLVLVRKYSHLKRMKRCIRFDYCLGGYVRMAGEDADTVELKPGKKVGLVLNAKDEVAKLVLMDMKSIPMFALSKSNKLI